jgi:CBS domain-containing protein
MGVSAGAVLAAARAVLSRRPAMNVDALLNEKGRRVITMRPNSPLTTVIRRMKLEHIGAVILSDDGEAISGILSERDIVNGLAERGADLLDCKAADIMTHEVVTCTPQDNIKQVMIKMTTRRVRHVPVVQDGHLAGLISIGDVVKHRLQEAELETTVLRDAYLAAH